MKTITIATLLFSLFPFGMNAQWEASSFVPSGGLTDLSFPTPGAAYIASGSGPIYKSTDAGVSWNQVYDFGPFTTLSDLHFLNADTGFAAQWGSVQRTFNGGVDWDWIPIHSKLDFVGDVLFTSSGGLDTAQILTSIDLGDTWTVLYEHLAPGAQPFIISFQNDSTAMFINPLERDRLYKTTNAFQSIDTIIGTLGDMTFQEEFHFTDTLNGYFYGSWGSQSDPTRTWYGNVLIFPMDLDGFGVLPVLDIDFGPNALYASSLYGKIFRSLNKGQYWTEQPTSVNGPIRSIAFATTDLGIAVSDNIVLFTSNGGTLGVSDRIGNELQVAVFPNPTRDQFTLSIDARSKVDRMVIMDLQGRLLDHLAPTDRLISTSHLSSGQYLLQIWTDQGVAVKPFVIE